MLKLRLYLLLLTAVAGACAGGAFVIGIAMMIGSKIPQVIKATVDFNVGAHLAKDGAIYGYIIAFIAFLIYVLLTPSKPLPPFEPTLHPAE